MTQPTGQPYAGYPPPAPPPRKSWPARHKVLTMLGVLGVLVVGAGVANGGGGNDPAPVAPAASPEGHVNTSATEAADGVQETTPAPPADVETTAAKPPPKPVWHTVVTVTGSSDKRTPAFTLTGERARLRYTARDTSGIGAIVVAIYVVEKGHSLAQEGGFAEVTLSEPGSSSTELANPPGSYYLDIAAANARWTVTVEELR